MTTENNSYSVAVIATAVNIQLRQMVNRNNRSSGKPPIESEYPAVWGEIIKARQKYGLYTGEDFAQREDAVGCELDSNLQPKKWSRTIPLPQPTQVQSKEPQLCRPETTASTQAQPKEPLRLSPVAWLYSGGNPHGGILYTDQHDNKYSAYTPLWGLSHIGTSMGGVANPPMNDAVLKQISGPFTPEEQAAIQRYRDAAGHICDGNRGHDADGCEDLKIALAYLQAHGIDPKAIK